MSFLECNSSTVTAALRMSFQYQREREKNPYASFLLCASFFVVVVVWMLLV